MPMVAEKRLPRRARYPVPNQGGGRHVQPRVSNQHVARTLGRCRVPIGIESITLFRQSKGKTESGLRGMDIVTVKWFLLKNDNNLLNTTAVIDFTITHPCVDAVQDHSARQSRHAFREAEPTHLPRGNPCGEQHKSGQHVLRHILRPSTCHINVAAR